MQIAPEILLPFVAPRQSQLIPFPKGQADHRVSQQLKMPPLHQGPTNWQHARQKMRGPVELHCPVSVQWETQGVFCGTAASKLVLHRQTHAPAVYVSLAADSQNGGQASQ